MTHHCFLKYWPREQAWNFKATMSNRWKGCFLDTQKEMEYCKSKCVKLADAQLWISWSCWRRIQRSESTVSEPIWCVLARTGLVPPKSNDTNIWTWGHWPLKPTVKELESKHSLSLEPVPSVIQLQGNQCIFIGSCRIKAGGETLSHDHPVIYRAEWPVLWDWMTYFSVLQLDLWPGEART